MTIPEPPDPADVGGAYPGPTPPPPPPVEYVPLTDPGVTGPDCPAPQPPVPPGFPPDND